MFGRKSAEEKKAEEAKKQPQTAKKDVTAVDVGRSYDLEKILPDNLDILTGTGTDEVQKGILAGAAAAFNAGKPENLQFLIANAKKFSALKSESMLALVAKGDEAASIISLAVDKVPQENREWFLDEALTHVFDTKAYQKEEQFIAALVEAGAHPEGTVAGRTLAMAITNNYSNDTVKLLCDNGASFKNTLLLVQTHAFWNANRPSVIEKIKAYREAFTGQPATEEGELLKEVKQLRQEIAELREELTAMKTPAAAPAVPANESPPAKENTPPKRAYPAL